ncbi:hypothetical protein C2R22_10760 [Salinigranum rubrum]|uniref:Uncharacterized protein n=1 Tax=Salinigranum rubrum TaxID=755307 RepID=A0A2I8VJH3_9EURY|nr:hypothetical protein [Salinigranum rubrum]AUV82070.1 hypothetical protein C2R22_10760 [Salinigranum rubrum]
MSRDLMPNYQFGRAVSPKRVDEADINDRALQAGEEITIWSTPVPADKAYVWGYGQDHREAGDANYIYAEFLEDGSGSGTDGNTIRDAEVVVAVTDSTQEDTLAKTTLGPDAGDLADAKADNRTERPLFPEHSPGATEDKHLQLRLRARSGADGVVVGNDSDVHIGYGVVG